MEEALRAALLAQTALANLVSNRIYWLQRPQGSALPSITLQVVSGAPDYHMDGRDDLVGKLVQIDIWASTYSTMKPIERALIATLDALRGGPFWGAFIQSQRETTEAQDGPDATGSTTYFRSSTDARIWHAAAD